MKALRIAGFVLGAYVLLVVAFESFFGLLQPALAGPGHERVITLTTTDAGGNTSDRIVALIEDGEGLYVSSHHWPRGWYHATLAHPEIEGTIDGQRAPYTAVSVPSDSAEHDRLAREYAHAFFFRFVTGFAPRYFVRLDPR